MKSFPTDCSSAVAAGGGIVACVGLRFPSREGREKPDKPGIMAVIVQKFGGTSVADVPRIFRCARRVAETRRQGHDVAVVVSAMGHTTDQLIELAGAITDTPSPREMDMLMSTGEQVSIALMAMALQSLGLEAVSMTGAQLGIVTDGVHTKARIESIDIERLGREFRAGRIVVAAGFQGVSDNGQVTTLGRGGSDATAVALAERRLAAEEEKFLVGLSTSFFVFQAQRDLASARVARLGAVLDRRLSLADLEAVQAAPLTPIR